MTNKLKTRVATVLCTVVGLSFALSSSPLGAARTTFNPSIAAYLRYSSNLTYVNEDGPSDYWARLVIVLPVTRTYKKSAFTLSYSPVLNTFSEFSELDNVGHRVSFDLSATPTQKSSLQFLTTGTRTQDQGEPDDLNDANLPLSQRATREILRSYLRYSAQFARRWGWVGRAAYRDSSFTDIPGIPVDVVDEDRSSVRADVAVLRNVGTRTSVGMSYGYSVFRFEESPEQSAQNLTVAIHRTIDDQTYFRLRLGGSKWSEDLEQSDISIDSDQYGAYMDLTARRAYRRTSLALRAYYRPSAGFIGSGSSTDGLVRLSLVRNQTRKFYWGLYLNYLRRDPRDPLQPVVETASIGLPLNFRIFGSVRIKTVLSYVYQTDVGSTVNFDAGMGLVWYPLEDTRLGGGGR